MLKGRTKYPNSGALFENKDRRSEKSPDYTGNIEIEYDLLVKLANSAKETGSAKARLIAYIKGTSVGGTLLSLKISEDVPYKPGAGKTYPPRSRPQLSQPRVKEVINDESPWD